MFKLSGFGTITKILRSKITLVVLLILLILISYHEVNVSKRKLKRKEERYEYNKKLLETVNNNKIKSKK